MDVGYASSIAYFMGIVILLLSFLNMYINRSDEKKDESEARRVERRAARREKRFAKLDERDGEARA